jgi:hypothetical protein
MNMKPPSQISEPDATVRHEIYKLYVAIFNSQIGDKKTKLMTYIFAWYPWSWRVVGISKGAVSKIEKDAFYPLPKRIVRDHFLKERNETYTKMLQGNRPMDQEEWWNLFWDNDQTVIMTKEEHDTGRELVQCHQLNWRDGYFACNSLVGFKYRKNTEGAYLKDLKKSNSYKWVSIKHLSED